MPEGCAATQRHLDGLEKWTDRNLMKLRAKSWTRRGTTPGTCIHWGPPVGKKLGRKFEHQVECGPAMGPAAKTAHYILGCLRGCTEREEGDPSVLVSPGLECCVECWAAQFRRDMDTLERVQSRDEGGMSTSSEEEKVYRDFVNINK